MASGQSREVGSAILRKTADSKLNGEARRGDEGIRAKR
jgi:hypothetical protein